MVLFDNKNAHFAFCFHLCCAGLRACVHLLFHFSLASLCPFCCNPLHFFSLFVIDGCGQFILYVFTMVQCLIYRTCMYIVSALFQCVFMLCTTANKIKWNFYFYFYFGSNEIDSPRQIYTYPFNALSLVSLLFQRQFSNDICLFLSFVIFYKCMYHFNRKILKWCCCCGSMNLPKRTKKTRKMFSIKFWKWTKSVGFRTI